MPQTIYSNKLYTDDDCAPSKLLACTKVQSPELDTPCYRSQKLKETKFLFHHCTWKIFTMYHSSNPERLPTNFLSASNRLKLRPDFPLQYPDTQPLQLLSFTAYYTNEYVNMSKYTCMYLYRYVLLLSFTLLQKKKRLYIALPHPIAVVSHRWRGNTEKKSWVTTKTFYTQTLV